MKKSDMSVNSAEKSERIPEKTEAVLTPFCREYWENALREFTPRKVVLAAVFTAMAVAVSGFSFKISENLFIMFTFLITSVGAAIYGPCLGTLSAVAADLLTWLLFQSATYPFFIGYTLSEVLATLVYSFFFYRSRITVAKIAAARVTVNLFINALLGSVWSAMLYSKGYYYFFAQSIFKNSILLIPEIVLIYLVMQQVIPIARRFKLVPDSTLGQSNIIKLF